MKLKDNLIYKIMKQTKTDMLLEKLSNLPKSQL